MDGTDMKGTVALPLYDLHDANGNESTITMNFEMSCLQI